MNCFGAHSSVIVVFISLIASQHKNNPLVRAETVRHSSTYIIFYLFVNFLKLCILRRVLHNQDANVFFEKITLLRQCHITD